VEVRTVMVDIGAWRQALQCDAESVLARVDNGQIRWAFNIAVNLDSRRDLRFYATELIAPEIAAKLTLDQVIMGIIGQGEAVRTGRMECEWVCSHQIVHALIKAGELQLLGPGRISRASLVEFLKHRLQS
jgi:hypothetical protein